MVQCARRAIHLYLSPSILDALANVCAAQFALNTSLRLVHALQACRPTISTSGIHFDNTLVPLISMVYPIHFAIVDNPCIAPIILDAPRCLLQVYVTSWASSSTWCIHFIDVLVLIVSRTLLITVHVLSSCRVAFRPLHLNSHLGWQPRVSFLSSSSSERSCSCSDMFNRFFGSYLAFLSCLDNTIVSTSLLVHISLQLVLFESR